MRKFLIFHCITLFTFLVDVDNVYENPEDEIKHTRPSPSTLTSRKKGKHVSAWTINEEFTFRITAICRLNCDVNRSVEVSEWFFVLHSSKKNRISEIVGFSLVFFSVIII